MSRSYKKTIYKDKGFKKLYWRKVRSRQKNEIRSGVHPQDVTSPKKIMNDYDYSDYSCGHHVLGKNICVLDEWEQKWVPKLKRK